VSAIVLLGHGSPDPRSAAGLRALGREVSRQRPGARVEVAFLDHDDPGLTGIALELGWAGYTEAIVVPAFLTTAFHVRVDVPASVALAQDASGLRLIVAEPIGPDLTLLELLGESLPDGPVVLACAGTRDSLALASLEDLAREWSIRRGAAVAVGYASASTPTIETALASIEHDGQRASIASFTLLPGILPDRIAAAAEGRPCTQPLGIEITRDTARVVLARADAV
jgi:sirohydrochlorin ferrochelatase